MKIFIKRIKVSEKINVLGEVAGIEYAYFICIKVWGIFTKYLSIHSFSTWKKCVENNYTVFCNWEDDPSHATQLTSGEASAITECINTKPNLFLQT